MIHNSFFSYKFYRLSIIVILLLTTSLFCYGKYRYINLKLKNIELALTAEQKATGLMFRTELCSECAMLFVYEQPSLDGFWMKNTLISLDIIFIDHEGQVVTIYEKTEPLNSKKTYYPSTKYSYVLEGNAGFVKSNGISVGNWLNIKQLMTLHRNP